MLNPKDEQTARKALAYLVRCDMTKAALSAMGSYQHVDKTKLSTIIYNKVTNTAKKKGA